MSDKIITPAVLVTGSDNRGNEFCFFKSGGQWVDSYNETYCSKDFIDKHVLPQVQKVYFADVVMTGAEWVAAGCPMETVSEFIEPSERKQQADIIAERYDAKFRPAATLPLSPFGMTACADYDITPPQNMPVIDIENIKEIEY